MCMTDPYSYLGVATTDGAKSTTRAADAARSQAPLSTRCSSRVSCSRVMIEIS
jgi:hypothetical protein